MNNQKKISQTTINKILSVVIAIVLWIFVMGEVNPVKDRTFNAVPVQLKNIEVLASSNLAIAGSDDYTVDVKVKGQRSVIDRLEEGDVMAEADLFGYSQGQNYVNVTVTIPDNTELVEVRSQKIQVVIEELVAVSKPVRAEFLNVPQGKEIGGLSIQPVDVEVSGAKSLVHSVSSAFGRVDVTDYVKGRSNTAQMELQPINDGEVGVENVRMSSQYADVTYTVMDVKEVELEVNLEEDIEDGRALKEQTVPKTIRIKGTASNLKNVTKIATEPVKLSQVSEGSEVTLTPILPEGVELSQANPVIKGVFYFKTVTSRTLQFSAGDIRIQKLPEGMEGQVSEGTFSVTVWGEQSVLDKIDKEHISLSVDASHAQEAGTLSLPIVATCTDEEVESIEVEPIEAEVSVHIPEE